jgi:hypothetical protein
MELMINDAVFSEALKLIRADPKVGRGTCAMVDECMNDAAVREYLETAQANSKKELTVKQLVKEITDLEESWRDKELDITKEVF